MAVFVFGIAWATLLLFQYELVNLQIYIIIEVLRVLFGQFWFLLLRRHFVYKKSCTEKFNVLIFF